MNINDDTETEIITADVEIEIQWKRGSAEARENALRAAAELPFAACGAGAGGCYAAKRGRVTLHAKREAKT